MKISTETTFCSAFCKMKHKCILLVLTDYRKPFLKILHLVYRYKLLIKVK